MTQLEEVTKRVLDAKPQEMTPLECSDLICLFWRQVVADEAHLSAPPVHPDLDHALHQLTERANLIVPDDD